MYSQDPEGYYTIYIAKHNTADHYGQAMIERKHPGMNSLNAKINRMLMTSNRALLWRSRNDAAVQDDCYFFLDDKDVPIRSLKYLFPNILIDFYIIDPNIGPLWFPMLSKETTGMSINVTKSPGNLSLQKYTAIIQMKTPKNS